MAASSDEISQHALINMYRESTTLMHLAKTPMLPQNTLIRQLYAWGFNAGGRPDGLWLSFGTSWLGATIDIDNPKFPPCCYLYEIDLKHDANIIHINTSDDFAQFDATTPNYWLNMDYFDLDYTDYLTGENVYSARKKTLSIDKLCVDSCGSSTRDILARNKIIFFDAASASHHCNFYQGRDDIERFKYKDWCEIAKNNDGIFFNLYDLNDPTLMKYIWYQSLDVASACIWNRRAIANHRLLYEKIDDGDMWAARTDCPAMTKLSNKIENVA